MILEEAHLSQRERISYTHVFLGWLTDRAIHCTPQMYDYRLAEVVSTLSVQNNKLSYRRETARQLRTSFSARSLIAQFTEHRICCTTTPWTIKKGTTFIFMISLANVYRFQ